MATHIVLGQFTDQGIRNAADTSNRADAAKELAEKVGAKVRDLFWTIGRYDVALILEAPDDETMTVFGLSAGKLNTSTCKSYAYVFNTKTSEYFRCQVSLALTRDNKEVINVQADGGCAKKPRIFDGDSTYSFDATETEPPNTNSFFGPGGYAVWASDNNNLKVRGCIIISSGLGTDISKCIDMKFE